MFRVTAAVLHIGNIDFEDSGDGCAVAGASEPSLNGVSQMLGLDADKMRTALTFKTVSAGGVDSSVGMQKKVAENNRNGLAKAIYSKLFDWIIERVNKCFPFPQDRSVNYIGILDIAGFEYFRHNSFEQFCINYCNEKLQQFFNLRVLKDEQELSVAPLLPLVLLQSFVSSNPQCVCEHTQMPCFALKRTHRVFFLGFVQLYTALFRRRRISHNRIPTRQSMRLSHNRARARLVSNTKGT